MKEDISYFTLHSDPEPGSARNLNWGVCPPGRRLAIPVEGNLRQKF